MTILISGGPILVTGAGGKTGRHVAMNLRALGREVRTVSRSSTPAFDWRDDRTWDAVIRGCDAAYIAFQPDIGMPGADAIVGRFAAHAVELGCRRLVLLSGRGEPAAQQAEQALIDSGAAWTILRSAFFMQNFTEGIFAAELAEGQLSMVAHTVGEPFVDAQDIAAVATVALTTSDQVGMTYELTGPELLTFADVAARFGATYTGVSVETYSKILAGAGLPEDDAAALAQMFHEVLDGRNAHVGDGVLRATGHGPRSFAELIAATTAPVDHA